MEPKALQHNFELKLVEKTDVTQFNELLRYVFQVTTDDLHTFGWEEEEIRQAKLPVLEQADVIGWYDQTKLISQIAIYPFTVNIFGQQYAMGGITGVGTYPEYARMGLMHDLMISALQKMRENKQFISYLYPYSIPFYRRKGWEIISDKMTFKVKDTQLPKTKDVLGMVERTDCDDPLIFTIYDNFAAQQHGSMIRTQLAWDEYWRWESDEMMAAVYRDTTGTPTGFLFYRLADEVFYLKEMVFLNEEARSGLWNFISAHFSMVNEVQGSTYTDEALAFLLDDSEIKETITPYYMGRIVDLLPFLQQFPFKTLSKVNGSWCFAVEDPLAEWNRQTYELSLLNGTVTVYVSTKQPTTTVTIQTLTTMFLGYKRPTYLKKIGRLNATSAEVQLLESIIPADVPYFSDYF
ncbi:GNAT family N-acetyltransferase [Brochothrix campestris]|uniref:N-acetyltransferase GCN5 n=1 Tax=Brochothrix campestris FSL F6-1037 TaxID=1265861 RepID=W7CVS3_9LIST|nr:GNAT family N-acetyltransferase [Brochothrix campestris]EUJ39966.1 N-acetyltransferase GCN5 [Brochothrix campestris FSL F6-1037]